LAIMPKLQKWNLTKQFVDIFVTKFATIFALSFLLFGGHQTLYPYIKIINFLDLYRISEC